MAKKVILKDDNIEIMPITRGELVLDSSGQLAFHSSQFLATQSLPGLMSGEDKTKLDSLEKVTVEDKKVEQVNTTTNNSYRILFSNSADDTTKTEGTRKSAKLLFNPSTGALTATALIGKLDWSNLNDVPENFTPAQHIHNTSEITALTSYSKASSASDLVTTDTLNVALGKLEYKADAAYDFYKSVTGTDNDEIINKWEEIVDFIDSVKEGSDITDMFVTRETDQTITGVKTFALCITIQSGLDTKLVLNNTDTESKYQFISFRQNGTEYGSLGTSFDDNLLWNQNYILHSNNYSSYALPLSGGTISGIRGNYTPLIVETSSLPEVWLQFKDTVGNTYIGSDKGQPAVYIEGDHNYLLLHSGNYSNYALPLSGGTMNGVITMPINYQIQWGSSSMMIYGEDSNAIKIVAPLGLYVNSKEVWHSGNFTPSNYLPLSGGTLSGNLTVQNKTVDVITLYRDDVNNSPSIKFTNKSDGTLGYIGVSGSGSGIGIQPFFMDSAGTVNKIWHSGNDGSGSGLDADMLDGKHLSSFITYELTTDYVGASFNSEDLSKKAASTYIEYWDGAEGWFNSRWGLVLAISGFHRVGSSDSYVLLGGGGHKLESNLSVNYATSAGNADTVDSCHKDDFLRRTATLGGINKFVLEDIPKGVTQVGSIGWTDYQNHPHAGGLWMTLRGTSSLRTALILFPSYSMSSPPILYSSIDGGAWQGGYQLAYTSQIPTTMAWGNITGKPSTFTPSSHTHDDRYYTESEADSRFINHTGDTMTGPLTFANGTWNVVGDDAAIGDYNAAGMLGLKSINNNIPGIGFHNSSNTLLGRLQANGSNLLWNDLMLLHSSNWPSYIGGHGYVMREYTIDATGLDLNTWYPVTMTIGACPNVRIEIRVSLNSGSKPSWSTHGSGFAVRKIWEVNGSGWGTNTVHRTVFVSDYAHASADPVRGMGDMGYSSTEYVYVRGGGRYYFYTSHNITPYLRTSTYVGTADPYYQAISPTTTAPGTIAGFLINRSMYASHFYENSDIKLKENINLISSSDNIPLLKEFNWKSDGKHSYGLIAQELEEMGYSELVEESGDHKTVNYSAALSLIVGKLQVKIKELEKEIEILKKKN